MYVCTAMINVTNAYELQTQHAKVKIEHATHVSNNLSGNLIGLIKHLNNNWCFHTFSNQRAFKSIR